MTLHRDWRSIPEKVREEAIDWRVRLAAGDAGDEEYAAFGDWIASDEAHAAAYELVEFADGRMDAALASMPLNRHAHAHASTPQRRPLKSTGGQTPRFSFNQMTTMAASLAAFVALSIFATSKIFPPHNQSAAYAAVEAPETVMLDDGTSIVLAPGASMTAVIDAKGRRVSDFKGAGFFHVASDAARPFTISFDGKTVTVVGTQFEIKAFSDSQSVSVIEGVVRVGEEGAAAADPMELTVGEKAEMQDAGRAPIVSNIDTAEVAPWRDGILEFEGASLAVVVQSLNEIYGNETFLIDRAISDAVTFSGVLHVSSPQIVASRLEELLPVSADFSGGNIHLRSDERRVSGPSHED